MNQRAQKWLGRTKRPCSTTCILATLSIVRKRRVKPVRTGEGTKSRHHFYSAFGTDMRTVPLKKVHLINRTYLGCPAFLDDETINIEPSGLQPKDISATKLKNSTTKPKPVKRPMCFFVPARRIWCRQCPQSHHHHPKRPLLLDWIKPKPCLHQLLAFPA